MWTILKIAGVLALIYTAITLWVYFSQHRMLYHPRRTLGTTPIEINLPYKDVWLTTALGTRIHAWWVPSKTARFTLLFSHGNGGNLSHRLESLRIFHDLGLSVLVYDYSGYGQSNGEPSERATRADSRAAWEWLVTEQNIPPQSIILFGRSLGGGVTAELAAELAQDDITPAGMILESTFTSVPDMGSLIYPWLPVRLLSRYQYNTRDNIFKLQLPVLFAHSPDDDVIPYALGRDLFTSYTGPKTFLELAGDHNTGYVFTGKQYIMGLDNYLSGIKLNQK